MQEDFQHVHPTMKGFLAIEGRERLSECWEAIWVPTDGTREAFAALTDCYNAPSKDKPRGLVLTGESDTGKSRTMRAFCAKHPPVIDEESEYANIPVVYIKAPDKPSRTLFYKSILAELGHPILYNEKEEELKLKTLNMICGCKVRLIMVDEMHDIARERMSNDLISFLQFLKHFINQTGRPFVIAGVPVIFDVLAYDREVTGRFDEVVELEPLKLTEFVKLLKAFERMMPLRRPSDISGNESAVQLLFTASEGYIGRAANLLMDACKIAIDSKEERITLDILKKVPDRSIRTYFKRKRGD